MKGGGTRLQRRIAIALTAIVLLMVVVQSYLAYSTLEQQEDDLVDQVVASEAQRLIDRLARGDESLRVDGEPTVLTTRFRVWLLPLDGRSDASPTMPAGSRLAGHPLREGTSQYHVGMTVFHYLSSRTPQGMLVLEYDASADEAFVYRFGADLVVSGLVIVLLAAVVSMSIARLVVAPFRRMAILLAGWSPGSAPIPPGRSDEEALLLQAFDSAQRRIEAAHARERDFAANLRHELRTPLTALRTDAEMLLLLSDLPAAARARLARIQQTVDAIATDVEAMQNLAQAREAVPEDVDLARCVDDVWTGLQHRNADGGLVLHNVIAAGTTRRLDRLALMTILRNLLLNAVVHASPGHCRVEANDHGLTVSDDGPGIAAADLPRIFERHFSRHRADLQPRAPVPLPERLAAGVTSATGDGIGLAIARETALSRGWSLSAESLPGQGSRFTLIFAVAPVFDASSTQS